MAQPGQVADATPPATAGIGRTDLLGGWTITSGANSCQLFMTLTSWTGRLSGNHPRLQQRLPEVDFRLEPERQQVILASMAGSAIAHLKSAGLNRFDGTQDTQGGTVSFYR